MKMLGLELKRPLIVAPMAGGPSSVDLVVATSEAGALGSVGAAYSTSSQIEDFVNKVRQRTQKPIAINLFIPHPEPQISQESFTAALQATEFFRRKFNLPQPDLRPPFAENFDAQFEVVLKTKPEVLSFVFGKLESEYVKSAKKEKIFLVGTATSLEEALILQDSGVDAITLQGVEAGGHRGIFDPEADDPHISAFHLLDQCIEKVYLPLIAAGGIMNSGDIQQALSRGAQAVQMGTAFLVCQEAGTSSPYRRALLESEHRRTKLTRAFSGRLARGIENAFMLEIEKSPQSVLPFPAQNKFTRDIRGASAQINSNEALSLWAGTGDGKLWTGPVAQLIEQLFP